MSVFEEKTDQMVNFDVDGDRRLLCLSVPLGFSVSPAERRGEFIEFFVRNDTHAVRCRITDVALITCRPPELHRLVQHQLDVTVAKLRRTMEGAAS